MLTGELLALLVCPNRGDWGGSRCHGRRQLGHRRPQPAAQPASATSSLLPDKLRELLLGARFGFQPGSTGGGGHGVDQHDGRRRGNVGARGGRHAGDQEPLLGRQGTATSTSFLTSSHAFLTSMPPATLRPPRDVPYIVLVFVECLLVLAIRCCAQFTPSGQAVDDVDARRGKGVHAADDGFGHTAAYRAADARLPARRDRRRRRGDHLGAGVATLTSGLTVSLACLSDTIFPVCCA